MIWPKLKRLAVLSCCSAILSLSAFASEFSSSNIGGSVMGVENPFGPLISFFQSWITSFTFGAYAPYVSAVTLSIPTSIDRNILKHGRRLCFVSFSQPLWLP